MPLSTCETVQVTVSPATPDHISSGLAAMTKNFGWWQNLALWMDIKTSTNKLDSEPPPPWPFRNMSIYRLLCWGNTGSNQKSIVEIQRLVDDVITAPEFRPEHVSGCKIQQEYKKLDDADATRTTAPFSQGDWQQATVTIDMPTGTRNASGNGKPFTVPDLHYQSLKAVIISAFSSPMSCLFHFSPFKRLCRGERVYDELYTSDAWIQENDKLQQQTNEPGCKLEKVIASLMFWSDSTHLANFGTAKVWPLYLYFGNLSKYLQAMPNADACHHVTYIPSVSPPHNHQVTRPQSPPKASRSHPRLHRIISRDLAGMIDDSSYALPPRVDARSLETVA